MCSSDGRLGYCRSGILLSWIAPVQGFAVGFLNIAPTKDVKNAPWMGRGRGICPWSGLVSAPLSGRGDGRVGFDSPDSVRVPLEVLNWRRMLR